MAAMRASALAVGFGDVAVDLVIGAVLFVVVIAVTAVLMFILQAVLPGGDAGATEADAAGDVEEEGQEDEAEPAPPHAASGG